MPFRVKKYSAAFLSFWLALIPCGPLSYGQGPGAAFVRYSAPQFLTFEELKSLSEKPAEPGSPFARKLEQFFTTPIVSNEAHYSGAKPYGNQTPRMGPFIRVASWNIEFSKEMDRAIEIFTGSSGQFIGMVDTGRVELDSEAFRTVMRQRGRLQTADVILLQEMDIGVKRSGYVNAADELARALNMNYAYGPAYLEIDPVKLGTEEIAFEEGAVDQEATDYFRADPDRYKGSFGSAVLSRYPIKHVEVFPLKTQPYDWYWDEKQKTGFIENARRIGTKTVFLNEVTREIKAGGRAYFRVDLHVPELPGGTLTIINVHLEIKCKPAGRDAQMKEILSYIKDIPHPLILMGDFNAAPTDISPTSIKKIAKNTATNPGSWLNLGLRYVTPHASALSLSRGLSNITKNLNDPFALNLKVLAPNASKPMFKRIQRFRFSDGSAFDFRGNEKRSVNGRDGLLSNSNQRAKKGFKTTFSVRRPIGIIGKYRLDWVFVRSGKLQATVPRKAPYALAPHFGETLDTLHLSLKEPVSDHHPNVIDLPLEEPDL